MRLEVSPQIYAQLQHGITPEALALWAQENRPPSIPCVINYDLTPHAWRLLDADGAVIIQGVNS